MLDNLNNIKKIDSQNMLGSLQHLSKQVEQIWEQSQIIKLPKIYKNVNNIVVIGMGGSALGAHVLRTLYKAELRIPLHIVRDYEIPRYVSAKTLVIASSYSGSTEEVLNAVKQAKTKKAKIISICAGGKLAQWSKSNKVPALVFGTENNPSGQPRMGLGYSIVGQMILLSRTGLIKLARKDVKEIIKTISYYDGQFGVLSPQKENIAKQIASLTNNKSVWYFGSEHLEGNMHIAANQLNENAKRYAGYFILPEASHHLLEGMSNPATNTKSLLFVLINSQLYHKRTQKRYEITKKVLDKNSVQSISYSCREKNKLNQVCEMLVLGSYVSFYSAMLKKIDPSPIPFVDFFKSQMAK